MKDFSELLEQYIDEIEGGKREMYKKVLENISNNNYDEYKDKPYGEEYINYLKVAKNLKVKYPFDYDYFVYVCFERDS